jgi:hypothetical protein
MQHLTHQIKKKNHKINSLYFFLMSPTIHNTKVKIKNITIV